MLFFLQSSKAAAGNHAEGKCAKGKGAEGKTCKVKTSPVQLPPPRAQGNRGWASMGRREAGSSRGQPAAAQQMEAATSHCRVGAGGTAGKQSTAFMPIAGSPSPCLPALDCSCIFSASAVYWVSPPWTRTHSGSIELGWERAQSCALCRVGAQRHLPSLPPLGFWAWGDLGSLAVLVFQSLDRAVVLG